MNPEDRSDEFVKYTQYLGPAPSARRATVTPLRKKTRRTWRWVAAGTGLAGLLTVGALWAVQDEAKVSGKPDPTVTTMEAAWTDSTSEDRTELCLTVVLSGKERVADELAMGTHTWVNSHATGDVNWSSAAEWLEKRC